MSNQDVTTHKFVAVLNKKVEIGKIMNVLAHLCISLAVNANQQQIQEMGVVNYIDKDGFNHKVSKNSFVVLKADNGSQIRNVRNLAKEKGIMFVDFTNTMQEGTFIEQLGKTKQTPEIELEYYGVVLFGEIGKVGELTSKFQLWH